MIRVRRTSEAPVEELDLEEFERRARAGEVAPQHEVCFPAVTGDEFVPARTLELYRGLYTSGLITFRRYFHLARMPYLTLAAIGLLCVAYFGWQGGAPATTEELVRQGAKSPVLMVELGHWWRLITANLLHVSGFHLTVNAIFLFNLGGPTEAVFRRHDYALVLLTSALGTGLLSAAANPTVSCGASGVVFGVWGAAAVFGMRHRALLPDRYRRYFIGSVVPYSVFALYLGFAIPGVDNWGHLGGLVAGSGTAMLLPARLLEPRDRLLTAKLLGVAAVLLALAAASLLPAGTGPLSTHRYYAHGGLVVPIPVRWRSIVSRREGHRESYAFANGAGVTVGVQTRLETRPIDGERIAHHFIEGELAKNLETSGVRGMKISEPHGFTVSGVTAGRVSAELLTPEFVAHATYVVLAQGYYHYVVSLTAPRWLEPAYRDTFTAIVRGIQLTEPDSLASAKQRIANEDTPFRHAQLALAQAHAGEPEVAAATLAAARARWPRAAAPMEVEARLLHDNRHEPSRACTLIDTALAAAVRPTLSLYSASVDILRACERGADADILLTAALARFPDEAELERRQLSPGSAP